MKHNDSTIDDSPADESAEPHVSQFDSLLSISHKIALLFLTIPDSSLYSQALTLLTEAFRSPRGSFCYIDEAGDLVCPPHDNMPWIHGRTENEPFTIPRSEWDDLWGEALLTGTPRVANEPISADKPKLAYSRLMAVPIVKNARAIGLLLLADKPSDYTLQDMVNLEVIAGNLAPMLHARRLQELTESRRKQAEETLLFSHHFLEIANRHARIQPLIDAFVSEIRALTPFTAVGISIFPDSDNQQTYVAYQGYPADFFDRDNAFTLPLQTCSCAYRLFKSAGEPVQVPSIHQRDLNSPLPHCSCHMAGFASIVLLPIQRADQTLGVIHVASTVSCTPTPTLVAALKQVAAQLSQAIVRVTLEEQLLRHKDHLAELVDERTRMLIQTNLTLQNEIAERQRAESERLQATIELDTVFQALPDLFFRIMLDGTILDYRAGNPEDLYLPPHEFLGKRIQDVLPEDAGDLMRQALANLATSTSEIDLTYSLPIAGHSQTFEARFLPVPKDCAILVIRNITEKRAAEDAVRASEASYRTLAANLPCLVYRIHLDEDHRTEFFNDNLEPITGYHSIELQDDPISSYASLIILEDRAIIEEAFAQAILSGTSFAIEYRMKTKNGKTIHVLERGKPVFDSNGIAVSIDGILLDITEHKRAQEALLQASRLQATATLAGGIAHDFNNLMVGVLGNSELLRMALPKDGPVHEMLDEISQAAQRAGNLAKQLLAYARGGKYAPAPTNINDPIRESLSLQQRGMPAQISLLADLDPALPLIHADPTQLSQVIMNLTINAVEAITGNGAITVRTSETTLVESLAVEHDTIPPGRYVQLTVQDTGSGIPPDVAAHIFEPFYSTKFQGRGLGLAAVYGIVKNHNGHVFMHTTPRIGTRFTILFPVYTGPAIGAHARSTPAPRGTETILLVEDDTSVLSVTRQLLASQGYQVITATTAEDALTKARRRSRRIHLAILDIDMPDMDGVSLYPLIKKIRPNISVLFYSGFGIPPACQTLLDADEAAFLAKPYSSDTLFLAVRKALDTQPTSESA